MTPFSSQRESSVSLVLSSLALLLSLTDLSSQRFTSCRAGTPTSRRERDSSPLPSFQTPHSENTDSVEDQIGTEGQSDRNGVRLHVSARETRSPPDSMVWRGRLQRGAPVQDSSLQFQFCVSGLKWVRMARILQFTGLQITPEKLNCPLMFCEDFFPTFFCEV